jgi:exodeoxyribonuclease X
MQHNYAVVDTETTGFDHEEDRLVEIAAVRSDGTFAHSLVCPGDRRISFGAMATHHITHDMVANAPSALDALSNIGLTPPTDNWGENPDVLVFHNAKFDRGFLPEWLRRLPYICTWRCALHLVPGAESHANGALWYELGLSHQMPTEAGSIPHRALFDALMTRDILEWMIDRVFSDPDGEMPIGSREAMRETSLLNLITLTQTPVLLTKCRFGKHRDSLWENIPSTYMEWVLTQDFDEDTKHTCRHWLNLRGRGKREETA